MIYKKYLLIPVKGKRINKSGDVKVYTPKRKAYAKGSSEEKNRMFLSVYTYKKAIKLIDKLSYIE